MSGVQTLGRPFMMGATLTGLERRWLFMRLLGGIEHPQQRDAIVSAVERGEDLPLETLEPLDPGCDLDALATATGSGDSQEDDHVVQERLGWIAGWLTGSRSIDEDRHAEPDIMRLVAAELLAYEYTDDDGLLMYPMRIETRGWPGLSFDTEELDLVFTPEESAVSLIWYSGMSSTDSTVGFALDRLGKRLLLVNHMWCDDPQAQLFGVFSTAELESRDRRIHLVQRVLDSNGLGSGAIVDTWPPSGITRGDLFSQDELSMRLQSLLSHCRGVPDDDLGASYATWFDETYQ
jgi:hypothetical protein